MAVITPTPKTQFLDAAGAPLSGGLVYTYQAGTTTPQATYTDSTGATPNSNPVVLDSRGEANIWLGEATYKFKLCDAQNVEIWTVDYISAPTTALSPVLSGNVTISTDSSGPALKITQTGTGPALRVQDSADPDATPFIITADGYVGIGTVAPAEALDIDNGAFQLSSSGTARTVVSANITDSIIEAKDNRNLVLKTNGAAVATLSGAGVTTLANQLVVSSGGASVTGNSSVTGTFTSSGLLTVSSGGASITGNSTVTGTLTSTSTLTATTSLVTDTISERTLNANVTINGVPVVYNAGTSYINGDYLRISSKTAQASTSGSAISFTSIPTWARRITIMFSGVSLSGTDNILVQIGPASALATSGYNSSSAFVNNTSTTGTAFNTTGFVMYGSDASYTLSGSMVIHLLNPSTYLYTSSHVGRQANNVQIFGGGDVTLSGLLNQVSITRNGTNTFDAGAINVLYE